VTPARPIPYLRPLRGDRPWSRGSRRRLPRATPGTDSRVARGRALRAALPTVHAGGRRRRRCGRTVDDPPRLPVCYVTSGPRTGPSSRARFARLGPGLRSGSPSRSRPERRGPAHFVRSHRLPAPARLPRPRVPVRAPRLSGASSRGELPAHRGCILVATEPAAGETGRDEQDPVVSMAIDPFLFDEPRPENRGGRVRLALPPALRARRGREGREGHVGSRASVRVRTAHIRANVAPGAI